MLDLGASERTDLTAQPAEELLAQLAERAGEDVPWAHAVAEIRQREAAGEMPIGLCRLSEVLAPGSAPVPAPRVGGKESGEIVEVVRRYPCALLDAASPAAVARNLAGVLGDGKRVLVTGGDTDLLAAVRAALPEPLRRLCLDAPLPLSHAELRELRSLLVTSTPRTRARLDQALPDPDLVPTPDEVAALCRAAGGRGYPPRDGIDLLPELLAGLESGRLAALLNTARRCQFTLAATDPDAKIWWARPLLERVLFGGARDEFDLLLRRTTDVVLAADKLRDAGDQMAVVGTIAPAAVRQLRDYVDFLDSGGRARTYFRSPQQRAAQPVLRHLRLEGLSAKDPTVLRQALTFVELVQAVDEIDEQCRGLGIPEPRNVPEVAELNRRLDRVEEAARAAEHLRHEVLFIHPSSPVPVPDLMTVERVATAIVRCGGHAAMAEARARLFALADRLERATPPAETAPEVQGVVEALRAVSLPAYLEALAELAAAQREHYDEHRRVELLGQLRAAAPGLAASWEEEGPRRFTQGTARFIALPELLDQLPAADTADLLVLLGADSLAPRDLLAAAAAPRLLAVAAGFAGSRHRSTEPAEDADSVLGVLRRAGVPVVVAAEGAPAPAVPISPPATPPASTVAASEPPDASASPVSATPVSATPPPVPEPPREPLPVGYEEVGAPPLAVTEVPPPPVDAIAPMEDTAPTVAVGPEGGASGNGAPVPFPVPAQRVAPAQEAHPSARSRQVRWESGEKAGSPATTARTGAEEPRTDAAGRDSAHGGRDDESSKGTETEYVVTPLGIVARPVDRARPADDQRADAS